MGRAKPAIWPKVPAGWVLVPGKGIEPLTHCLQGNRSATELDRLDWQDSVDLNHDKQVNSLP